MLSLMYPAMQMKMMEFCRFLFCQTGSYNTLIPAQSLILIHLTKRVIFQIICQCDKYCKRISQSEIFIKTWVSDIIFLVCMYDFAKSNGTSNQNRHLS